MAILYSPYLIQNSGIAKLSSCVKLGIYCIHRYIIHWEYIILWEPDMVLLLLHSVRHLVNYPCHVSQLLCIWFKVLVYYNSCIVLSNNWSKNQKTEGEINLTMCLFFVDFLLPSMLWEWRVGYYQTPGNWPIRDLWWGSYPCSCIWLHKGWSTSSVL